MNISPVVKLRLDKLLSEPIDSLVFKRKLVKELVDLHLSIFGSGIPCSGCEKDIRDGYERLHNLNKLLPMKEKTAPSLFQLKEGSTLSIFGSPTLYTSSNMTDEVAISILSNAPKAIKSFEKFPDNWEEIVKDYRPKEAKAKPKPEQAKANGNKPKGRPPGSKNSPKVAPEAAPIAPENDPGEPVDGGTAPALSENE